jgi:hypothetical protein
MGNNWWRIIGKGWYYAGYEIFPKEEKILRVYGVTEYDENIRREKGEYAEKWRDRGNTLRGAHMDKPVSPCSQSEWGPKVSDGYDQGQQIHETNLL